LDLMRHRIHTSVCSFNGARINNGSLWKAGEVCDRRQLEVE
jgi:hypothetical protein